MLNTKQKQLVSLLINQQGSKTVSEYAQELGVSKRTINNYLKVVEPYLNQKGYSISGVTGKGISVNKTNENKDSLDDDELSVENRRKELCKMLFFDTSVINIYDVCDEFVVSLSSIKNDVDFITKEIIRSNITDIRYEDNSIINYASEDNIQKNCIKIIEYYSSLENIEDLKDVLAYFTDKDIVDLCTKSLDETLSNHSNIIADKYYRNILEALSILIYRISNDHHIVSSDSLDFEKIMNLPNTVLAREILNKINKTLNIHIKRSDISYLADYTIANRMEVSSVDQIDSKHIEIYERIIKKMEKLLEIDIFKYEDVVKFLMLHLHAMVFRLENNISIHSDLLENIKQEFGMLFNLTWLVLESESETLGVVVSEDEVGFLCIHFQNVVDLEKKSNKVLIVSDQDPVTSSLVLSRVRNILPPLDIVEVTSISNANKNILGNVDFVISTVSLDVKDVPIVIVSPLIGEVDIRNIQSFYNSFIKKEGSDDLELNHLLQYFNPKFVYEFNEPTNKDKVLNKMCDSLYKAGYVKEGFKESVLQRESIGSTDNNFSCAVPHGQLKYVNKSIVSIALIKKPIKWNKYYVKTVIMLAINENDLYQSKEILQDIYNLIKSERFSDILNKKDFLQIILNRSEQ